MDSAPEPAPAYAYCVAPLPKLSKSELALMVSEAFIDERERVIRRFYSVDTEKQMLRERHQQFSDAADAARIEDKDAFLVGLQECLLLIIGASAYTDPASFISVHALFQRMEPLLLLQPSKPLPAPQEKNS